MFCIFSRLTSLNTPKKRGYGGLQTTRDLYRRLQPAEPGLPDRTAPQVRRYAREHESCQRYWEGGESEVLLDSTDRDCVGCLRAR